jgi:hypothetical protein
MLVACIEAPFTMVRRHGKMIALAHEEKKKRERGESSTGLDGLGTHAPKHQRREYHRLETHAPGAFSFYFQF